MSWSIDALKELAQAQPSWAVAVEGDCLNISNDEGIDAFVYAGEQQVVAESALFPAAGVTDVNALNALILRTHSLLPLTTIGINQIGDEDYYVAFGALSTDSKASVIVEEVDTLFANVGEFLELYSQFINLEVSA